MSKTKRGKWPEECDLSLFERGEREFALNALKDEDPDWHWLQWKSILVVRLFDEGVETERVICRVIHTKIMDDRNVTGSNGFSRNKPV